MLEREARLYEKLKDELVRCHVCPRRCFIIEGTNGYCRVRVNRGGVLYVNNFCKLTAMNVDPIEKKPFFHFWPGSLSFSISSFSCSFECPWCQNWNISQAGLGEVATEDVNPEKVVELAKRYGCRTIAYTYNEPIIWLEYILETAKLAVCKGILNILVTNGYATEETLKELTPYISAANVDIKSFDPKFYTKYCRGRLEDVLNATEIMAKNGWHVEVTYLIIPELNDSPELFHKVSRWVIDSLGADTPLHFTQFHPMHKMTHFSATPAATIKEARKIALKEGVHYAYVGNIPGYEGENTNCPNCRKLLVKRWGFEVLEWTLTSTKNCPNCGYKIAVIGEYEQRRRTFTNN